MFASETQRRIKRDCNKNEEVNYAVAFRIFADVAKLNIADEKGYKK